MKSSPAPPFPAHFLICMNSARLRIFLFFLVVFLPAAVAQERPAADARRVGKTPDIAIDDLFRGEKLWAYDEVTLEADWQPKGFKWSSKDGKDRGILRAGDVNPARLTAFAGRQPLEEVVFVLKTGKLAEVSINIWNKGDSADAGLSEKKFMEIVDGWSAELNKVIAPAFEDRGKDNASAAKAERRLWIGKNMLAQLEYSGGSEKVRDPYTGREKTGRVFQGEFIRLRFLAKPDSLIGVNTSTGGSASVRRADLARTVTRDPGGDVVIPGIPMIDQGQKGYCAVATAARVFNYYGIPADQHEMAQVSGNAAGGGGTNPDEMEEAMRRISGKYKTRFQTVLDLDYQSRKYQSFMRKYNSAAKRLDKEMLDADFIAPLGRLDAEVLREVNGKGAAFERFLRVVRENIDKGVPVMWALQLGKFPENGEAAKQLGGGHMRLIIGYNTKENDIIFSDSWGPGHEKKRMAAPDASAATIGLYLLQPAN